MKQEYDFTKADDVIQFQTDHYGPAYRDYIAYFDYLHTIPDEITIAETRKFLKLKKTSETLTRIINAAIMSIESVERS